MILEPPPPAPSPSASRKGRGSCDYDVAVIGGGVIGWSSAWHLIRSAPSLRVAVIEPDPSASSALRGTGGARAQFGSRINIELSLASIEELKRFHEETGCDIGFRQLGYLLFTADEERARVMREAVTLQRECGVPVREFDGRGVAEISPYLTTDDLVFGAISYSDGLLSAPDVLRGYREAALALRVAEVRGAVLSRPERDGAAWEVGVSTGSGGEDQGPSTSLVPRSAQDNGSGVIRAKEVVIAAGHNSGRFGLPVRPEMHQLYTRADDACIPGDAPMIVDCDSSFHFRRKGAGLVAGYNDPALTCLDLRPDGGRGVGQPEYDPSGFERMASVADRRCPQLFEGWSKVEGWAGCYSVTPDHNAILGRLEGLVIATGFGGHGVMHSPAAGKIVAELILDGESSFDLKELSPDRFDQPRHAPSEERMVF